MKKMLILLMCIMIGTISYAQTPTTVTIGTGTTSHSHPIPGYFGWHRDVMLYYANEINTEGLITEIAYDISTVNSSSRQFKIYMLSVKDSVLTTSLIPNWNAIKNRATLVYTTETAGLSFPTAGWQSIELDNPFYFDNESNLLILIEGTGCAANGGCEVKTKYSTTSYNTHWSRRKDTSIPSDDYDIGSFEKSRSNIKITIDPEGAPCLPVRDINVSDLTSNSATVTWTAGSTESQWFFSYRTDDEDWSPEELVQSPQYIFSNMESNSSYWIRIKADCGNGETSPFSEGYFHTLCDVQLPIYESFDSYNAGGSATANFPECWSIIRDKPEAYSYISTASPSSSPNCYVLYNASSAAEEKTGLISPILPQPLSGLQTRFMAKGSNGYLLLAGYMTDPSASSTFVACDTIRLTSSWETYTVKFDTVTSEAPHIVFMHGQASTGQSIYLDNIWIEEIPPCDMEVNMNTVTIENGTTSVILAWDEPEDVTHYDIRYRVIGDNWSEELNVSSPLTLSGLTSATEYEISLRANCSQGNGVWSIANYEFRTANEIPYSEYFDGDIVAPGWYNYIDYGYATISGTTTTGNFVSAPRGISFYNSGASTTNKIYFISPEMDPSVGMETLEVRFKAKANSTNMKLSVGIMNIDSLNSFSLVQEIPLTTEWKTYIVPFDNYDGSNHRIAFGHNGNSTYTYIYLDNVDVNIIPDCPEIDNLNVSDFSHDQVRLHWHDRGIEEYKVQYTDLNSGNIQSVISTDHFTTITGLSQLTEYSFKVKGNCDSEIWSDSIVLTTRQTPATLPFTEDFESDPHWIFANGTQQNAWVISDNTTANNGTGGNNCLYISNNSSDYSYTNTSSSRVFAYKRLILEQASEYIINYKWKNLGESASADYLQVWLAPDNFKVTPGSAPSTAGWINLYGSTNLWGQTDWQENEIIFTIENPGHYNLVFYWYNNTSEGNDPPAAVDSISLKAVNCLWPKHLYSSNVTTNEATVHWSSQKETITEFQVVYGLKGFDPDQAPVSDIITITNDTIAILTGLTPNTAYDVYVRSVCDEENSFWSSKTEFTTFLIPTQVPFACDFEDPDDNRNWMLANSQHNYWEIGSLVTHSGSSALYITNGTAYHYDHNASVSWAYRDILFNDDYEFQLSFDWKAGGESSFDYLKVYIGDANVVQGTNTSLTDPRGTVVIPNGSRNYFNLDTAWSHHRNILDSSYSSQYKRVYFAWRNDGTLGDQIPAAVDNFSIKSSSCPRSSALAVSDIGHTTANITWSAPSEEYTEFEVVCIPKGSDPDAVSPLEILSATDTTFALTDLDPDTFYDVYVRTVCGPDNKSFWSHHITFTTYQEPATLPFICDFEDTEENGKWSFVNSSNNYWKIGSQVSQSGDSALYITNGTAYHYDNNISISWAYRDIYFNNADEYSLSFDWKSWGEDADYFKVYIGEAGHVASSDNLTTITDPQGAVTIKNGSDTYFYQDSVWSFHRHILDTSYASTYKRVYFVWRNNASTGYNPPAAIDNFSVRSSNCLRPLATVLDSITINSAKVSWKRRSAEQTQFEVVVVLKGVNPYSVPSSDIISVGDTTTWITELKSNTYYDVYVRTVCGSGDYSLWNDKLTILTYQIPAEVPFTCDFENAEENRNWTLINSTKNAWKIGNQTSLSGDSALYITNGSSYQYDHNACVSWAYRDVIFNDALEFRLSFDWKAGGESTFDYFKVYIGDASPVSASSSSNTITDPRGAVVIQNGEKAYFNLDPAWSAHNHFMDTSYSSQYKRVYFAWRNDGSVGDRIPAAIDNFSITSNNCPRPLTTILDTLSAHSAKISWNSYSDSYTQFEVVCVEEGENPDLASPSDIIPVSDTTTLISGLNSNTYYDIYIRTVCGNGDHSWWNDKLTILTPQIPAEVPFLCDFEDRQETRNWTFANSTKNYWKIGNQTSQSGDSALYITNGTAYKYDHNACVSWAYRDILFNDGHEFLLSFDWKAGGESTFDYLKVYIGDASPVTASNSSATITDPQGAVIIKNGTDDYFNLDTTWSHYSDYLNSSYASQYKRVYFAWRNDGSGGNQIPAAIDNFSIISAQCGRAARFFVNDIQHNTAVAYWVPESSNDRQWEIVYGATGFDPDTISNPIPVNDTTYVFQNLRPNTSYDVYVRMVCGDGSFGFWSKTEFTTGELPTYTITATIDNHGTITPGTVTVTHGADQAFTFSAENGYQIQDVVINGQSRGVMSSYTFRNVQGDSTIHVNIETVGIHDPAFENRITLYPNPTNSTLNIMTEYYFDKIDIRNIVGEILYEGVHHDSHYQVDVSQWSAGVYFIRFISQEGMVTKKFIKE